MKRHNSSRICFPMSRRGTTLSEVLVSLLVMSVGVVSLITLFPISVLRSAQATHLTNSANLRYNVEAMLGARPELYRIAKSWVASGTYAVGDLVTPTELTSIKSPPVIFKCTRINPSNASNTVAAAGEFEPDWYFRDGDVTLDNEVEWTTYRVRNYVIDPLGAYLVEEGYRQTANPISGDYYFGNYGSTNTADTLVRAFAGGARTEIAADDLATLPDSWVQQVESDSLTFTPTSCELLGLQDLITPVSTGFPVSRIVMFDITGKVSHVRRINSSVGTVVTSQTVDWTTPLPSGFFPAKARVDIKDRRYTWLLSIRRSFGGASLMDVVVFFKRPFSGKDEQLYPATFQTGAIDTRYSDIPRDRWANHVIDPGSDGVPGSPGDDDGINGPDDLGELGWPGSDDVPRNWLVLQYDSTGEKPFIKKGGFVTDAENLRWYRILDFYEAATPRLAMTKAGLDPTLAAYTPDDVYSPNHKSIFIRVENKVLQNGTRPTGGAGGTPRGRAMLMRGIIDVYPIRTHLTWEN